MGLFGNLFGGGKSSNLVTVPDQVWMSTDAKFTGLTEDVKKRLQGDTMAVLLVAQFPDVLERLEEITRKELSDLPVKTILAANLNENLNTTENLKETDTIDIVVAERHPLLSVDMRLEEFLSTLPFQCRLIHHLSMEDPLIELFVGDFVKSILVKLGMKDDECIESPMVTRRIKEAQRTIEKNPIGNADCQSATEWLEINCPK